MRPIPLHQAFRVFYITFGIVVLLQSLEGFHAGHGHGVQALALVEALGAVLFLVPRTMRIGATILLGVFALAFVAHALWGDLELTLVAYAGAAFFALAHGPVASRALHAR